MANLQRNVELCNRLFLVLLGYVFWPSLLVCPLRSCQTHLSSLIDNRQLVCGKSVSHPEKHSTLVADSLLASRNSCKIARVSDLFICSATSAPGCVNNLPNCAVLHVRLICNRLYKIWSLLFIPSHHVFLLLLWHPLDKAVYFFHTFALFLLG